MCGEVILVAAVAFMPDSSCVFSFHGPKYLSSGFSSNDEVHISELAAIIPRVQAHSYRNSHSPLCLIVFAAASVKTDVISSM
jgi:hypothetical protein